MANFAFVLAFMFLTIVIGNAAVINTKVSVPHTHRIEKREVSNCDPYDCSRECEQHGYMFNKFGVCTPAGCICI